MTQTYFYTPLEAQQLLRIGKSKLYELFKSGELKYTKLHGKTLIRREDLEAFIDSLGDAA